MAIDTRPKPSVRAKVEERIESGLCLHCDKEATRLGCCDGHYHQYRNELLKQPLNERELFRARQIRIGNIAASRQGQRVDLRNPFSESEE